MPGRASSSIAASLTRPGRDAAASSGSGAEVFDVAVLIGFPLRLVFEQAELY